MRNRDIREAIQAAGIKHWQVAEALGWPEGKFCRMLRREVPPALKEEILRAVQRAHAEYGVSA
jgi:hypothetical protein